VAPAGGLQAVDALLFIVLGEVHEAVLLGADLGSFVDPAVHHEHDRHGDVEGNPRGVDCVPKVLADETDSFHSHILGPAKKRRKSDGGRQEPNDEDHLGHQLPILSHGVRQRPSDAQIPGKKESCKELGRLQGVIAFGWCWVVFIPNQLLVPRYRRISALEGGHKK